MLRRFAVIGFVILLLLSGCAETRLQTVDDSMLQQQLALLEDGKTTKQEILSRDAEYSLVLVFDDQETLARNHLRRIMP